MEENQTNNADNFLSLPKFIDYLVNDKGIKIGELAQMFDVDDSTIRNWGEGKRKTIPSHKIRDTMANLVKRGIRIGRITSASIEVLNAQSVAFGGDSKSGDSKAELELLKQKTEILLSENIRLEKKAKELEEQVKELKERLK